MHWINYYFAAVFISIFNSEHQDSWLRVWSSFFLLSNCNIVGDCNDVTSEVTVSSTNRDIHVSGSKRMNHVFYTDKYTVYVSRFLFENLILCWYIISQKKIQKKILQITIGTYLISFVYFYFYHSEIVGYTVKTKSKLF